MLGDVLVALIAVPLLLLLVLVLLQYGNDLVAAIGNNDVFSAYGVAALVSIAVGWLFVAVVHRKTPFHPIIFLAASLSGAAAIYCAYISSIDVAWVSDFGRMWNQAVRMVSTGDYSIRSIHNERVLPILVPTILLFGAKAAVVPIVNLALLLSIQLAGYDLVRRMAGHRAAQGFVVLWIAAMEPTFALLITSHDLWGLFFLVIFLWGFRAGYDWISCHRLTSTKRWLFFGGLAFGLAVLLSILEMQRELAPFVFIGFVLAGLLLAIRHAAGRAELKHVLMFLVLIFAFYSAITSSLKYSGSMMTSKEGEYGEYLEQIRMGAYASSLANGKYAQGQSIYQNFFDPLDAAARQDLVEAIPLSDFVLQPEARIANVLHRGRGQAMLGSQTFFYQAKAETRFAWLLPLTRAYNVCYSIVLAALSLWLILPLLRRLDQLDGLVQLGMLSALVGSLLLIGESQPRYIFPLWFILPQMSAVALAKRAAEGGVSLRVIWCWDLTRGVVLLLVFFFLMALAVRSVYSESRGRVLAGWLPTLKGAIGPVPHDWFRSSQRLSAVRIKQEGGDTRAIGFGDLALVLKIPTQVSSGGASSAKKMVCVGDERRALGFFYYMPYQNPAAKGAFTLEAIIDGRTRWQSDLPGTEDITYVRIADIIPANTCAPVEFRLRTNRAISRPSWIRASHTDVYFPRLVY